MPVQSTPGFSVIGYIAHYRQHGAEPQKISSKGYNRQQLAVASHVQARQQTHPAPRSIPICARQEGQWDPEPQQQQFDAGITAAASAQPPPGHCEHAVAVHLEGVQQQQSSYQPSANAASVGALGQSVSREQSAQLPVQDSNRAGVGVHGGAMEDDMCDPMELTWEGVLQAASATGQAALDSGDALQPWSSIR